MDHAQMVELVDTQDLKSCSRKRSAGSIPALSTFRIDMKPGMKISGFVVLGSSPIVYPRGTEVLKSDFCSIFFCP